IMVMENAALNAVRAYLDPGESAVGTAVNVRHLAATPVGRQVTGEAEVRKVDGRQLEFAVRAREGDKEIGIGTHSRVVIDLARSARRLGPPPYPSPACGGGDGRGRGRDFRRRNRALLRSRMVWNVT